MSMKYFAAYALVSLNHPKPSQKDVAALLKASGITFVEQELTDVFECIGNKDIKTLIAEGAAKMSSNSCACAAPAPAEAATAAPKGGKPEPKKAESKKEKEKAAPPPEEDDGGMLGLFD